MEIASSDLCFHSSGEGHGEKCFSEKRERELHFVWQSATGLIKWNSDKLHCLMDIGVAFERLGRGDKSREGSMEIWQTRGYIYLNLHVMQSCLWKEKLRRKGRMDG